MNNTLSFIPLGGVGDVTRNMYVYEQGGQILVIDCGLGFADETMLGVDLLLPDISYLLQNQSKIVGMLITHGHEDHLGALPFVLPQLSKDFPIFATQLTAALSNEKLKEFGVSKRVQKTDFNQPVKIGNFIATFIRVTHSVPDTSNIFIQTPAGNFYHGSDFKFDLTPFDEKKTDFLGIAKAGLSGVTCLMSDCLRSEKKGSSLSEYDLTLHIEEEMRKCIGKCIVTTYSSNISRINQAVLAAEKLGRRVCFVGRSLIKTKEVALHLGYLHMKKDTEIQLDSLKNYSDKQVLLLVAGSQGQENSALSRIANGDHRDVKISPHDTIIFSSDPIPGNEVSVNSLVDQLSKSGARVVYSDVSSDFHVSGHASQNDLMLLMNLTNPKYVLPIGGTYRQMIAYQKLANKQGFGSEQVLLLEDGQEIIFTNGKATRGKKFAIRNVYVDQVSGEEVEQFVLRDRQKISKEGIAVIMTEIDSATGQMTDMPNIVVRGLSAQESQMIAKVVHLELKNTLSKRKGRVTDWIYIRKLIGDISEKQIFKTLHRRPLVLPVVIEV